MIIESPFVKEDDDEGFLWSFRVIEPATNQQIDTSISPYALLNSLGEERGEQEFLTCGCGVAECARIGRVRFSFATSTIRGLNGIRILPVHPHIHLPTTGTFLTANEMAEETTYDMTAVAAIADGVENLGWKYAKTGKSTNMCRRYVP